MVDNNIDTSFVINHIRNIQKLTGAILIKCEKWNEGDRFPTFTFSTTGDDDYDYNMEIYYDDKAGWKIASRCVGFDYRTLKNGIVPFLHLLNYCQATIKYEDVRKVFGIEEENNG